MTKHFLDGGKNLISCGTMRKKNDSNAKEKQDWMVWLVIQMTRKQICISMLFCTDNIDLFNNITIFMLNITNYYHINSKENGVGENGFMNHQHRESTARKLRSVLAATHYCFEPKKRWNLETHTCRMARLGIRIMALHRVSMALLTGGERQKMFPSWLGNEWKCFPSRCRISCFLIDWLDWIEQTTTENKLWLNKYFFGLLFFVFLFFRIFLHCHKNIFKKLINESMFIFWF